MSHVLTAEQAVIGSVLLSGGRCLDDLTLKPTDFSSTTAETIFTAMLDLHRAGKSVDPITVSAVIPKFTPHLHEAVTATPTAASVGYYAEIVAKESLRRRVRTFGLTLGDTTANADAEIVPEELRKQLDDTLGSVTTQTNFISSNVDTTINNLGKPEQFHKTPWTDLDGVIGGFRPGALYLVAARPGVGKTVIGLNIAVELAKHGSVAFSSLEMSATELHKRVIAQTMTIHMAELTGTHPLSDVARIRLANSRELLNIPLAIDDRAGVNVYDIRSFARSVHRKQPLAAVVVDYVGLIADHSKKERSKYESVTLISQQLKVLARDLNVPVIALAQLNREVESRQQQKPLLSDLRDSGSLEQDADVVILLRRDLTADKHHIDLAVAKNRHGETKTLQLAFQGEYSRATNK
jgi:replicative DNA helicase